MEKQIFKTGDRVFDIRYGWGKVIIITTYMYPIEVLFKQYGIKTYTPSGSTEIGGFVSLSFTEYTLDGFSQERPIDYNDYVGKWGLFRVMDDDEPKLGKLKEILPQKSGDFMFNSEKGRNFEYFQPLTEEQIKILGLEQ